MSYNGQVSNQANDVKSDRLVKKAKGGVQTGGGKKASSLIPGASVSTAGKMTSA